VPGTENRDEEEEKGEPTYYLGIRNFSCLDGYKFCIDISGAVVRGGNNMIFRHVLMAWSWR
jgi:hypothetical protein